MALTLTTDDINAIALAVWTFNLPIIVDCNLSIGGSDGTLFSMAGLWLNDCIIFKT